MRIIFLLAITALIGCGGEMLILGPCGAYNTRSDCQSANVHGESCYWSDACVPIRVCEQALTDLSCRATSISGIQCRWDGGTCRFR